MVDFWIAVGNFRAKRKARKGKNISKDDWEKHFRKILGEDQNEEAQIQNTEKKERETNSQGKSGGKEKQKDQRVREEAEEGGCKGLNRVIETGKVRMSMRKMKNKKAAGEDGLKVEYLKYLQVWIKKLTGILNGIGNT
ncbi:hypothetical protein TSAR_014333 [Trichomalopsis sarcophagae]|uniref:Uncharacterized protein n=1 Tax=Trichomalopsis sarcophagae TaxID=543379 RepID=A0A232EUK5_9HYME|nr:hypothetical protein TSAR_014333 [Trichomalopsis sarcophagae]